VNQELRRYFCSGDSDSLVGLGSYGATSPAINLPSILSYGLVSQTPCLQHKRSQIAKLLRFGFVDLYNNFIAIEHSGIDKLTEICTLESSSAQFGCNIPLLGLTANHQRTSVE